MQLLKNTSIKQRLITIIMAISFTSVLLTTLAISIIGVYNLRANIVNELGVSASIVGDRNKPALVFDDSKLAESNMNVFSVNQTIVQACLYKPGGDIFARYVREKDATDNNAGHDSHCPIDLTDRALIGQQYIELMRPIFDDNENTHTIGYIYIESTQEQINNYIKKQVIIAITVALAALAVSYFLAVNLQNTISDPILKLAATARQVSRDKDYSIRATTAGDADKDFNNEVTILTTSFNQMLAEIGERNRQLQQQYTELEKAKDIAESASRAKSHFLANISHELRTPLNAIIGFSSILMNQLFGAIGDQKYLEYAKDINDSGTHLLDIINDILDLSKAEAGKLTLNYEEVHIGKAINKCISILSERAQKGQVAITTDISKTLPALVADRLRVIQILLNILSNAVKFTEEGGTISIGVRVVEEGGEISKFLITMKDTGIGMSQEDIEKAFQSFGQVDSGLNRKYEGTGLGLPLTKKLMEAHLGSITIDSELGKGTLVTLTFPALPPAGVEYSAND